MADDNRGLFDTTETEKAVGDWMHGSGGLLMAVLGIAFVLFFLWEVITSLF